MRSLKSCQQAFKQMGGTRSLKNLFHGLFTSSIDSTETGFGQSVLQSKQLYGNHLSTNYYREWKQFIPSELLVVLSTSIYFLERLQSTLLRQQPFCEPELALLGIPKQSGFPLLFMEFHSLTANADALFFLQRGHSTFQEKNLRGGALPDRLRIGSFSKASPGHHQPRPFDSSMLNGTSTPPTQSTIPPQIESSFNDTRRPAIEFSGHSLPTAVPLPIFKKLPSDRESQDKTPTYSQPSQSPDPNSAITLPRTKRYRKRKHRSERSFWEYHYKQLTSLIAPFHEYHRNDPTFRTIWLTQYARNQKYQFKSNPHRCRLQNRRWAFIFAQRKRLAQQKHLTRVKWYIRRKQNERSYKLAYLQFKKGRVELLQKLGQLGKAYRLGWTADREWRAWKRLLKVNKRNRRRRKRTNYVLDDVQRLAERRIFDAFQDSKGD